MNYQEAVDRLSKPRNQDQKNVANNTVLWVAEDQCIFLRLHATNIIVYYPDGTMVLSSGGWKTITTKARLNEFLPAGWRINQRARVWYLVRTSDGQEYLFQDGITIEPDGTVTGAAPMGAVKKHQVLNRKINRYARDFVGRLAEGKIKPPSTGDCWFCVLKTQGGLPLGEATGDTDHLDHHLKERYYVPSLLVRAMEVGSVSIAAKDTVSMVWSGMPKAEIDRYWGWSIIKDQLAKAIANYMRRQYGIA